MDYTDRFIRRNGEACTIISRTPTLVSKCIVAPVTKSGWRISDRKDYWDGMVPVSAGLTSGEVIAVSDKEILVMSTSTESGVTKFMGTRTNANLNWQRQTASVDENYNVIMVWTSISADVPAFGQLVTARLCQEDPGLLPNTKYLFYIPASYSMAQMDRVVFGTVSCQVDSLDSIIMDGILRLQCSEDTRL